MDDTTLYDSSGLPYMDTTDYLGTQTPAAPASTGAGMFTGFGDFLSSLVTPAATLGSAYLTAQSAGKIAPVQAAATTATATSKTMLYVVGGIVAVALLIGAVIFFRKK